MNRKFPAQFGRTRKWKQSMRRRIRLALKALEGCRYGCAFNPDNGASLISAYRNLEDAQRLCSQRGWGR